MSIKTFAKVAAVAALGFTAASFAGGPAAYAPAPAMGHFYAELNAGVFNATHEVTSTDPANPGIGHGLQNSAEFGGGFGYGFVTPRHMYLGFDVNAEITPADATLGYGDNGALVSKLHYKFNFNLNPGVMINGSTLAYAVVGASYAQLQSDTNTINDDSDHAFGIGFGGGLRHAVTHTVDVFGEFVNYHYGDVTGKYTQGATKYTGKMSINGHTFKAGVLFNFL